MEKAIDKPTENITNILHEKNKENVITTMNSNDKNNKKLAVNNTNLHMQNSPENIEKDLCAYEFKKQIIGKLNKILYKLDNIENRINMTEEKMQFSYHTYDNDESDIHFPISTLTELISFEDQLQNTKFKDKVLNIFKFVGGVNAHAMIRNIMKMVMTDTLAQNFSWTGRKNKRSFKDLSLSKMIIQAVCVKQKELTENDIAEYTSKWLSQATVRVQRDKHIQEEK
ncbi:PREDICTED: uncharacterized protein LOC105555682 isoform X2 [Vollenhovia emeryi]|uniref:uncharacterized protein LOC105555682 isoform X2 n=1 Tax=Vollenhovia emeryi TaxID=411798 RepID=UPI0005F46AB6|nr:PREDICTED: uncharacterized protein LOC105555682 isoform X2 [Vollenhovia emeryi]